MLEGKAHFLREKAPGKKPNKTNNLTKHLDILWECGKLGGLAYIYIYYIYSVVATHSAFWITGKTRTPLRDS